MGGNETVSERVANAGGIYQLLVLAGLVLFVGGLLVAGVFGGMLPSLIADLDGGDEPPIDGDSVAPADPEESPPGGENEPIRDEQPADPDNGTDEEAEGSAEFEIAAFTFTDTVAAGDTVEVTVDVVNRGDGNGSTDVVLALSDEEIDRESVALEPGDSTSTTYQVGTADLETGRYEVSVATETDEQREWLEIEESGTPTFSVSDLDVPSNTTAGERIDVSYTVRNTGDASGTADVGLDFAEDRIDTSAIDLEPQEAVTVTRTIDTGGYEEGDYPVTVTTSDTWDRTWVSLDAETDGEDDDGDDADDGDEDDTDDDDEEEGDDDDGDDEDDDGDEGDDDDEDEDDDDGDDGDEDEDDDGFFAF